MSDPAATGAPRACDVTGAAAARLVGVGGSPSAFATTRRGGRSPSPAGGGRTPGIVALGRAAIGSAGLLALAGAGANAANVVVTVVIAHLLTGRAYGAQAQLVGVFVVLSMPGSALLVGVVRQVTALQAEGHRDQLETWAARVRRRTRLGLVVLAVVAVACRWWLGRLLGLPGPAGIAEVVVAGGGWALLSVERGLLQSRLAYPALARNLAVEGIVRTLITMALVAGGLGVEGVAVGLLAAMAASVVDARASLADRLPTIRTSAVAWAAAPAPEALPPPTDIELVAAAATDPPATDAPATDPAAHANTAAAPSGGPHLGADLTAAMAALALLAALQYGDLVIVGRGAPGQAGSYAAISVACKALVFGAIVLSGYLLPEAVWRWHHGRHALGPLGTAVGLLAVPAVALIIAATTAPRTLLRLVFGGDLTGAAPAFALLAVAMAALAVSVLLTTYLLGIGHRPVVPLLLVAVVGLTTAVGLGGGSPMATARAELVGQVALCAALAVMVGVVTRRGASVRGRRLPGTTAAHTS